MHLVGLIGRPHLFDHSHAAVRELLRDRRVTILTLSAKSNVGVSRTSGRSFTKMRNRSGPITEPFRTPLCIEMAPDSSDSQSLRTPTRSGSRPYVSAVQVEPQTLDQWLLRTWANTTNPGLEPLSGPRISGHVQQIKHCVKVPSASEVRPSDARSTVVVSWLKPHSVNADASTRQCIHRIPRLRLHCCYLIYSPVVCTLRRMRLQPQY